ncbi:pseudoazurin [Pseudomonas sp. 21LCFQ02]|uniref:pseudoazurin n=1 Tax=unclassified Pseudomonas TaxID=196821 RepID=UPI0004F6ED51|nr:MULTISPECIES: pseudoazurin [unclassified Pseudomonas]MCO8170294.1 pseudoazurin [Pseudomonas sp. 21LCFQ02]MCQ9425717.1 pseudoazurin [Pseudomonas sp. LJDD11]BAP45462.1 pseudoazurin [Pseudomonas sp. StFLB209]
MRRLACWLLLGIALPATAEVWEVKMLTRGAEGAMVYEPDHLHIAAGDTVRFLPTQSGHNAASLTGLLPQGADAFKSPLNKPFEHTFSVPGLYGVQCIPHLAMGMVMLIQVGEANSQAGLPDDLPARAKERFATQLQNLRASR